MLALTTRLKHAHTYTSEQNPGPITAANNGLVVLCGVAAGMHLQSRLTARMNEIEGDGDNAMISRECIMSTLDAEVVGAFGMPDVAIYDQRSNQVRGDLHQ